MEGRKRKENELGKEDRISELPDAILHQIFSYIDTIEAVRTCVLSKRWRYFWSSLSFLNFNSYNRSFAFPGPYYSFDESHILGFFKFINQVIARRDSIPIVEFRYRSRFDTESSVVESLICYAIKHQVQHLQITMRPYRMLDRIIQFPSCFYGCKSLVTLKLNCDSLGIFKLPLSFDQPSLKTLHLQGFRGFDGSIFSTCPNLETLKLEDICLSDICEFSICSPSLKSLDIYNTRSSGYFDCKIVVVAPKLVKFKYDGPIPFFCSTKNLNSLQRANIIVSDIRSMYNYFWGRGPQQEIAIHMLNILHQFHSVKSLTLSYHVFQYLSMVPKSLYENPSPFSNLERLTVRTRRWNKKKFRRPTFVFSYFLKSNGIFEYEIV